jgi:branched-chain amino acid transport system permease protein
MSHVWLPCGDYHQTYEEDQGWWQTKFIKAKMTLLLLVVFVGIPLFLDDYWIGVGTMVGYTAMGALGVQLLIGYAGLITLGHAAFIAVGAYTSTLMVLQVPWPQFMIDWGLAYPVSILAAAVTAGLWSVLFGLPSAKVKGFYLILTTMAAQFITVDFILTQYVSKIGGRAQSFSLPPGTIKIGPWVMTGDVKPYLFMAVLVSLMIMVLHNLTRTKLGRAWMAIRDNDIAASTMGINVFYHKLVAFFVAGAMAGVAGAFWVSNTSAMSPEHFPWFLSLKLVGVILIGGIGSIHGAIFGAAFWVLVGEFLQMGVLPLAEYWPNVLMSFTFLKTAFFGLIICAFLNLEPHGLAYRWWQIKNYFNLWPFSY